ncbi:TlpA family protein disulfide reductase [Zhouia sp. PK063]|uniref:TlpA family protein disulfide reductase n=1 Tax=Zhouia sp. PK063 TaxID=3373602 RepID=UPI0037BD1769
MKSYFFVLLAVALMVSCKQKQKEKLSLNETIKLEQPVVNPDTLRSDFMKWWTYYNNDLSFTADFIAVDEHGTIIKKSKFLKTLITGNFIPIQLQSESKVPHYKLFVNTGKNATAISNFIQEVAATTYKFFEAEGTPFPNFDVSDLEGNKFTNENLKGKIVVLKCWFIKCAPCVAEFPEVNKLADDLRNNKNVVFISLATDKTAALKSFLEKKPLQYHTIAEQDHLITNELHIYGFPTHIIVTTDGSIYKETSKFSELKTALYTLLSEKSASNKVRDDKEHHKLPPPPPPPLKKAS